MFEEITKQARQATEELVQAAHLKAGDIFVVGCSTSEVAGHKIGSYSNKELAEAIFSGIYPVLLEKGVPALLIYFFGFCFMALQFTGQAVFVALGKAKRATFFSIFRKVIIVVPLTILLPKVNGLGVDGVFWAEPISNLVGGSACFFTMLLTILPELREETR